MATKTAQAKVGQKVLKQSKIYAVGEEFGQKLRNEDTAKEDIPTLRQLSAKQIAQQAEKDIQQELKLLQTMKAEQVIKQKKDEEQIKRLMQDYPEDWLFHYHELMYKEEKQALKKAGNTSVGAKPDQLMFISPAKKDIAPKKQTAKLEIYKGTIDIEDLKNMTVDQFKQEKEIIKHNPGFAATIGSYSDDTNRVSVSNGGACGKSSGGITI